MTLAFGAASSGTGDGTPLPASREKLKDYWRVLVARRRVVFSALGAVVAFTAVASVLVTPEYRAKTTIQIEMLEPDILKFKGVVNVDSSYMGNWKYYQTQYKLLRSRAVLQLAAEKLDLANRPELARPRNSPISRLRTWARRRILGPPPAFDPLAGAIALIDSRLVVQPVKDSQLVEVSFTHRNATLACDVANEVAEAYREFNFRSRNNTTHTARGFLTGEVQTVQGEIADLERTLQDYSTSKDILALSDGTSDISEQALGDLNRRQVEARGGMAVAEAAYAAVAHAPPEALPEVLNSPVIANLKGQLADAERRYLQMADRFKEDWPPLKQQRAELENSRRRLSQEMASIARQVREVARADFERARGEAEQLGEQVDRQKSEVQRIQRDAIEYSRLRAAIENKRGILASLAARQTETETSERLNVTGTSNIRVVDAAEVPKAPVRPNKVLNLLFGLLLGTVAGVGLAFLLEHLDNTIQSGEDVSRLTGLAVLAQVPVYHPLRSADPGDSSDESRAMRAVDLASHLDSRSIFAETFRNLRTSILLAAPDRPPRHLMVTSCQPRDGKSTVSLNLAAVLTQLDRRVLLVDADLRVPRLHKVLGIPNDVGLSSYLSGNASLEDLPVETDVPHLRAIPAGPIPPNPSELLGSPRLALLLERLGGENGGFDFLIFDSSPLLSVSDPFILASSLDATILVVRAGETTRESLSHAVTRLRQSRARVVGAVLNGLTEHAGDYYYGRYRHEYAQDAAERASTPRRVFVRKASRRERTRGSA